MPTHSPVPFLALPTAVVELVTLTASLHGIVRHILFRHPAGVTENSGVVITNTTPLVGTTNIPSQVLFRFASTQGCLGRRRIMTEFGMQAHNIVAVVLTRLGAVVKIPAGPAPKGVRSFAGFNAGARGSAAFGKVPPTLRRLIVRVAHKANRKEFALYGIASIPQNSRLFVQDGIAGQPQDTTTTGTV
jgi:hypothetical protein